MLSDQLENLVFIVQRCVLMGGILPCSANFLNLADFEKKVPTSAKFIATISIFTKMLETAFLDCKI